MNDRLQRFLELEQLSPSRFADILGVQRSGMSHILSGRNKPSFDFIRKMILKFPTLNAEWLITGKGKVYKEQLSQPSLDSPVDMAERNLFSEVAGAEEEKPALELPENRINEKMGPDICKNGHLTKVIMIYSNHTFEEFTEK